MQEALQGQPVTDFPIPPGYPFCPSGRAGRNRAHYAHAGRAAPFSRCSSIRNLRCRPHCWATGPVHRRSPPGGRTLSVRERRWIIPPASQSTGSPASGYRNAGALTWMNPALADAQDVEHLFGVAINVHGGNPGYTGKVANASQAAAHVGTCPHPAAQHTGATSSGCRRPAPPPGREPSRSGPDIRSRMPLRAARAIPGRSHPRIWTHPPRRPQWS